MRDYVPTVIEHVLFRSDNYLCRVVKPPSVNHFGYNNRELGKAPDSAS